MYPGPSAPGHTPEKQNSLATMSKAAEQQSHRLSTYIGITS